MNLGYYDDEDGTFTVLRVVHRAGSTGNPVDIWWGPVEHIVPLSERLPIIDGARDLSFPEIGQKLLPFILPKKLREAVAGDLAEDFGKYAAQWGRAYAVRWLWWELGGLCIHRFGPTAICTAVAIWFRQKLGW